MVYSFLSGKGSQGKTVCAFNTIITWLKSNKGKTALALDIDHKQASMARLREFREKRELEPMFDYMAIADGKSLEAQLPRLSEQYDLVVIDGKPIYEDIVDVAIAYSDTVIVPVMAGGLEYFANTEMVGKILEVQSVRDDLNAAFLLTRHNPRLKLSKKITSILGRQGLPVLEAYTSNRVAYSESSLLGKSIVEYMHKAAREEWMGVYNEIVGLNSASAGGQETLETATA